MARKSQAGLGCERPQAPPFLPSGRPAPAQLAAPSPMHSASAAPAIPRSPAPAHLLQALEVAHGGHRLALQRSHKYVQCRHRACRAARPQDRGISGPCSLHTYEARHGSTAVQLLWRSRGTHASTP